ncbi:MAG: hypothetical protein EBV19_03305 [Flavobacteriia bacterium]|nr:hypothetical protein [Flavobacteriia bacterium]
MSFIYFYLLILLNPILGQWWKLFKKLGLNPAYALIPVFNYFLIYKITNKKPFWTILLVFPGVHLVMMMVANVSLVRRFGQFSWSDTLQGIFFPYLLTHKIASNDKIEMVSDTNWNNARELEARKWGDHIVLFMCLPVLGHALQYVLSLVGKKDKVGKKTGVKEWGDSLLFALVAATVIRSYVFEPFQIPTGSMEKTMLVGDFLFVNKLAYGPKVPVTPLSYPLVHNNVPWVNIPSYLTIEKGTYFRLPGFGEIQPYDIVVFNYPSGDTAVYDPRIPDGLMGHDYHGIVNSEAQWQFKNSEEHAQQIDVLKKKYKAEGLAGNLDSMAEMNAWQLFIDNPEPWKAKARTKLASGEFPGDPSDERHGGLIFRPVDKRENYIKRCIGIPGDKIRIENATVYRNGKPAKTFDEMAFKWDVTNVQFTEQEMEERFGLENAPDGSRVDYQLGPVNVLNLSKSEEAEIRKAYPKAVFKVHIDQEAYFRDKNHVPTVIEKLENINIFPKDFNVNNTMTDFQEFTVPKKGATVELNATTIPWYRRIISAYEGHTLEEKTDGIYIDGKKTNSYTFEMNYYWMMGDNRYNSADSRVWGFVPEDHIVGRASLVWFSKSPYKGVRWERILKNVSQEGAFTALQWFGFAFGVALLILVFKFLA